MQHFVLMDNAQAAQDFIKQRADRGFAKDLVVLEVPRHHNKVLQAGTFEEFRHQVNGFVFPEKIQHADHRRVGNLRQ